MLIKEFKGELQGTGFAIRPDEAVCCSVCPILSIVNAHFCLTLLLETVNFYVSCNLGPALPKAKENICYLYFKYLSDFFSNNFIFFSAVFAVVVRKKQMRQERSRIYMMDECLCIDLYPTLLDRELCFRNIA